MSLLSVGLALLTLTALYLVGPGWNAMGGGAALALLLHIGLGVALIVPIAVALLRKMRQAGNAGRAAWGGVSLLAVLCALTGLTLLLRAALGYSTARDVAVWWTHVGAGFLAVMLAGLGALRRALRRPPQAQTEEPRPTPALAFVMLFGPFTLWTAAALPEYAPDDYYRDLTATNAAQAQNPYFPAGVRLVGAHSAAQSAAYCGRSGCHVAAYREWLPSAHHFAGTDPFYLAVASDYAARAGSEAARWCQGCHDPIRAIRPPSPTLPPRTGGGSQNAYAPAFALPPQRGTSERGGGRGVGVDCVACHAAVGTPTRAGNGRFSLALPGDYPFAARESGWPRRLHDFLLRVRPGPHQRAYLKPALHRSAEFCSSCHRQSFNVPQNHYQFVRGPDPYGEWLSGPYSGRAARGEGAISYPPQTCQGCHFPRKGGKVSHAALGANTALPALRGDADRVAQAEAFLQADRITLDLFALRRSPARPDQPEEWLAPLDSGTAALRPGETVTLDIVVSNRGIGHSFPSGYEDLKDAWLEVTLSDGDGAALLQSGALASEADALPQDTHAYRMVALDRSGNVLTRHNLTEMVTTVYRRAIPPGSSDIARYTFRVPQRNADGQPLRGPLRLHARLRYRPLRPEFVSDLTALDRAVRSTTLAEATVALPLITSRMLSRPHSQTLRQLAERFVQYGNGLMAPAEGADLPRAIRAFQRAQELAPDWAETWLGLGRAYLHEVALLAARSQFESALRLAPDSAAARAYLGVVASKQGEYDRALRLLRPLAERFPEDAALQFDLGQVLFQLGNYEEAAAAFRQALAADPDNAAAHYRLKRCYQHLRRVPEARREEAIGRYMAEDKLASQLLPLYRRAHPEDALATQSIPVHTLRPTSGISRARNAGAGGRR